MKEFNFDSSKTLVLEKGGTIHQLIRQKKFVEHYNREGYFYDVSTVKAFQIYDDGDQGDGKVFILRIYPEHVRNGAIDWIESELFETAELARTRMEYLITVINSNFDVNEYGVAVKKPVPPPSPDDYVIDKKGI